MRRLHARVRLQHGCALACIRAPQQTHQRLVTRHQRTDSALGNLLPTLAAVRTRIRLTHRQNPVEQHDALIGPTGQVAVISRGDTQIILKFLVNIVQRTRQRHAAVHRERQTHRVARGGVGVLANNEDLHPAHRAAERIENIGGRRESTVPRRVLLTQKSAHGVNLLFDGGECCRPILAHNAAEGLVHESPRGISWC